MVAKGEELDNSPLRKIMKKKGKEVAHSLKCHGSVISKTRIKVGRNKKRGSSAAKFSLLDVLFYLHDFSRELTEQDKKVVREMNSLFEEIT